MLTKMVGYFVGLVAAGLTVTALADVRLPGIFSDHMVLQRDQAVPVWGWAQPGEEITVKMGVAKATTTTGKDGRWMVKLAPQPMSAAPLTLTVAGLVVGALIGVAAATPLTNALVDSSTSTTSTTRNERGMGGPGGNFGSAVRNFREAGAATVENIQASVGSTTLLYGIGAALLIAILGSALPSLMISKVKPADAMRNE